MLLLLFVELVSARLGAAVIVSPGGSTTSSGPFDYGPTVSLRWQEVYSASAFSQLNPGGGLITSFAFNFYDRFTLGGGVSNIQINLSTTSKAVDGLSTTFSQNVGADDTKVFGPMGTRWTNNGFVSFTAAFTLAQPFHYDPSKGNLLMDMRVYQSGEAFGMGFLTMDAANVIGDAASIAYGFDVNGVSGTANTVGLNTAFTVSPIPEPTTWAMLLLGAPALFFALYRTQRKTAQVKGSL